MVVDTEREILERWVEKARAELMFKADNMLSLTDQLGDIATAVRGFASGARTDGNRLMEAMLLADGDLARCTKTATVSAEAQVAAGQLVAAADAIQQARSLMENARCYLQKAARPLD